jgi:hypothetical protein
LITKTITSRSYEDFLKFGERNGVKIVYLFVVKIEEDYIEYIDHKGEIAEKTAKSSSK